MTFQIERLGFEELCAFLRLQAEDSFPDLKDEERLKMLAEKWTNNAECSTCRDNEGQLVGMIAFYANGKGIDFAYIPHVYVSPEFRKQGLFTQMFCLVKQYTEQKGFKEIKLEVDKKNEKAKSAYIKNGFQQGKEAKGNTVFMIKTL